MSRNLSLSLSRLFSARTLRHPGRAPALRRRRFHAAEGLEGRVLLAATIYTVNAITDDGVGSQNTGDLRYCIDQANANANSAGSVIQFDPTVFGTPQTITLSSTLTMSETGGPEVIDGPGASLVAISGNNSVEVFSVSSGVTATLTGLTIANGLAPEGGGLAVNGATVSLANVAVVSNQAVGTDGAAGLSGDSGPGGDGGTGGSGLGGGIYLSSGGLTLNDDVITDNVARGGAGGAGGMGANGQSGTLFGAGGNGGSGGAGGAGGFGAGGGLYAAGGSLVLNNVQFGSDQAIGGAGGPGGNGGSGGHPGYAYSKGIGGAGGAGGPGGSRIGGRRWALRRCWHPPPEQ